MKQNGGKENAGKAKSVSATVSFLKLSSATWKNWKVEININLKILSP